MTLIYDDEIKKIGAELFVGVFGFVVRKPLIEREVDVVGGIDDSVFDDSHGLFEVAKVAAHGLVDQGGAVREEQDALFDAAFPKPIDNLGRDIGFSRAGRHDQQHPLIASCDGLNRPVSGDLLIVARRTLASVGEIVLGDDRFAVRRDAFVRGVFGPECCGRWK